MYRCQACTSLVGPNKPLFQHRLFRLVRTLLGARQEIAKEIPVCEVCSIKLNRGVPFKDLLPRVQAPVQVQATPAPKAQAPIPEAIV